MSSWPGSAGVLRAARFYLAGLRVAFSFICLLSGVTAWHYRLTVYRQRLQVF